MRPDYEFEIWQDGMIVASASAPDRETALREAWHYATVYGQDGPTQMFEVARRPIVALGGEFAETASEDEINKL